MGISSPSHGAASWPLSTEVARSRGQDRLDAARESAVLRAMGIPLLKPLRVHTAEGQALLRPSAPGLWSDTQLRLRGSWAAGCAGIQEWEGLAARRQEQLVCSPDAYWGVGRGRDENM